MVVAWVDPKTQNVNTQTVMGGQAYDAPNNQISPLTPAAMSEHADQFEERDDEVEPEHDDLLEEQEHKGYGEDEGEREASLPDE